ncbi:MAG: hypothetical protein GY947_09675 [Rhodobacteraceae bacterium]|nr:hypothetical protein [Paracoccaceae bacterium]
MKPKPLARVLSTLGRGQLEEMQIAGNTILECYRRLEKAGTNLVAQCLANQGTFYEFDHYPNGDVHDNETYGQYFYHAHRPELREHGHFHTFLRAGGMPAGCTPVPCDSKETRPVGDDVIAHIVAISMTRPGFPKALFTVNRWVTDETFYSANDTLVMADRFKIDHTYPCLAVNLWITAMLCLFRPQIESLLHERDRTIAKWVKEHPNDDVFEDRELVVTSIEDIDVSKQIASVNKALKRRKGAAERELTD